ncbi:MAG: neutral/alkaline non-lysosomal ceramidase N-terminal domain-containing protein, partial [Planctomycetia bacterium]|nr:neutral/alkaline non-lysosomal ceramidase N-terminal domain-containing protein [Planctomycetia bacterium]
MDPLYYWARLTVVLVGLFLGMNAASEGADATKQVFRAGTGIADITPTEFPTALAGGFQPIYTSEVADPLKARALVLDDGTNRFVFLVIDNCLMPTELHEKIKDLICEQTNLKRDHICVSTTHCHSAPALTGVHNAIADEKYVKTLPGRAVKAVTAACANMQAVRVGWGKAREPRYVFCRRFLMKPGTASTEPSAFTGIREDFAQMNPRHQDPNAITRLGVPDQNVYVLAFQTLDGKPFALFANYSTHYIDRGDGRVSSAYFGVFCDRIGELLNAPPQFMAIMSNGTSGDNNSSDYVNKPPKERKDMFKAADDIAHAALKAWNEIQFKDWVPLRTVQSELTLKIRKPSEADIAEAIAYLAKMKKEG